MKSHNQCPKCGSDTYITKRMTLAWLDVFGASLVSIVIMGLVYLIFPSMSSGGSGNGKFIFYLLLGAIGLIGWIFTYFVKKETYVDESCTRCDFKKSEMIIPSAENIRK